MAIFIDYSRMAALKAKTERLVHAASRSVMSAYVPEFQQDYGLFAYGETDPTLIFSGVLERSLEYKAREDVLPIMDAKLLTSSVELSRELGNYEVFKGQINEEMKYKAPVNFAIEVVGRFKPMSQAMKEASGAIEVMEKLQKLYDKREAALDKMLEYQKKAGAPAEDLPGLIGTGGAGDIASVPLTGAVTTAAELAAQYSDYKVQKKRLEENPPPPPLDPDNTVNPAFQEWMDLSARVSAYETSVPFVARKIGKAADKAFPPHPDRIADAREQLGKAKELNEQMAVVIEESKTRDADADYDLVGGSDIPGAEGGPGAGDSSARNNLDKLLLDSAFFGQMEGYIDAQGSDSAYSQREVTQMLAEISRAFGDAGTSAYNLKRMVVTAGRAAGTYTDRYGKSGSAIRAIEQKFEEHRKDDEERKKAEKEAKGKLKEVRGLIKMIEKSEQNMDDFKELDRFFNENLALNSRKNSPEKIGRTDEDPNTAGKDAMEDMDGFFGGISSLLDATGDRLLQNEYASDHFTNFDFSKVKELTGEAGGLDGEAAAELLGVDNQELEYILYGFANPGGNIAAAYGEIFGMRLAIRTMEALTDPAILAYGNPLVILAKAILQGIINSIADMAKLIADGHIELAKTLKIQLTYKDHLRLFLFAHPANENKLSRMLALIRFNTGVNPDEHYTYLSGDASMTMPVWFLPGVMETLHVGDGTWEGGSTYSVPVQADYSY
ncbi:hypothetical protein QWJ34_02540 [Saccharibacillus sp. CPCC 101409]|uniref:hypothetical protein n=1 Tax=Saccharibacillus sp. CPCC 101409 TaxID=3058041 RepID=UPI00267136CD|nr:hypothetical protein [Saccharibacillus sp. CPCC 101409]MDO3408636.1 hypothetical protein [Saccharibacillus sp. CPCC 101409]